MWLRLKAFLKYVLVLSATVFLIWFSLRGLKVAEGENKWDYLLAAWQKADKTWLMLMAVITLLSHVARAERWRMLMIPTGHHTKLSYSFLSLMIGYLINLVIPRGGEISRCYNLYKLDKTPVEISFGTVVVERIVDVICLFLIIVIAFVTEHERLFKFIESLPISTTAQISKVYLLVVAAVCLVFIALCFYWLIKKNKKVNAFIVKTWVGFKDGLLSIFKLKNKGLFIFYSIFIWVMYFLSSYAVIRAFPQTSGLGFNGVLSLFAIGSIAMAAPLPGGAGSYHVLVPKGLVFLYLISESDAIAFTFIFHGWQTIIMIVGGAISLLISSMLIKKQHH